MRSRSSQAASSEPKATCRVVAAATSCSAAWKRPPLPAETGRRRAAARLQRRTGRRGARQCAGGCQRQCRPGFGFAHRGRRGVAHRCCQRGGDRSRRRLLGEGGGAGQHQHQHPGAGRHGRRGHRPGGPRSDPEHRRQPVAARRNAITVFAGGSIESRGGGAAPGQPHARCAPPDRPGAGGDRYDRPRRRDRHPDQHPGRAYRRSTERQAWARSPSPPTGW